MFRTHRKQGCIHTNAERRWIVPASNCSWHTRDMRTALFGKGKILIMRPSTKEVYRGLPYLTYLFSCITNCIIITFMWTIFKYIRFHHLFLPNKCFKTLIISTTWKSLQISRLNIRLISRKNQLTMCICMDKSVCSPLHINVLVHIIVHYQPETWSTDREKFAPHLLLQMVWMWIMPKQSSTITSRDWTLTCLHNMTHCTHAISWQRAIEVQMPFYFAVIFDLCWLYLRNITCTKQNHMVGSSEKMTWL